MDGDKQLIKDGKKQWEEVSKVLISISINDLHVLMCKPVEKGGYAGAWDKTNNCVKFSISTLRTYLPNHLKQMSDADMSICGCDTCGKTDDVHDAYKAKRRKIVAFSEIKLEEMDKDDPEKVKFESDLKAYKNEIFSPGGKSHKAERGWNACDQFGCGERVTVNNGDYDTGRCKFAPN